MLGVPLKRKGRDGFLRSRQPSHSIYQVCVLLLMKNFDSKKNRHLSVCIISSTLLDLALSIATTDSLSQ